MSLKIVQNEKLCLDTLTRMIEGTSFQFSDNLLELKDCLLVARKQSPEFINKLKKVEVIITFEEFLRFQKLKAL